MNTPDAPVVLVVDDEPDLRDLLTLELEHRGFDAFSAADGMEALDALRERPAAAVVTDVRMPRMNGRELLERLKAIDVRTPVVVFVSAFHDIMPEEAYALGAEAVLAKPFPLVELGNTLFRLLAAADERWTLLPPALPALRLNRHVHTLEAGETFALGRGGACLVFGGDDLRPGQRIQFALEADQGPLERLAGVGIVRWTVLSLGGPPACGIEFEYIDNDCRSQLVQWLASHAPRPYIPYRSITNDE